MGKALSHPARIEVLEALRDGAASPSDVAARTSASVGVLTYHMRELEGVGLIKLVRTQPVRGAVEHFYELTPRGRDVAAAVDTVLGLEPGGRSGRSRGALGRARRSR